MYRDKINKKSNLAVVVELFIMFLLLLVVIVVITMVCMTTREQSLQASDLTKAVICAENTAEVTKEMTDASKAAERIAQMENVTDVTVSGDTITAWQDGYRIEVTLAPEKGAAGTYVDELICIYPKKGSAIYQLHTGSYAKEDTR